MPPLVPRGRDHRQRDRVEALAHPLEGERGVLGHRVDPDRRRRREAVEDEEVHALQEQVQQVVEADRHGVAQQLPPALALARGRGEPAEGVRPDEEGRGRDRAQRGRGEEGPGERLDAGEQRPQQQGRAEERQRLDGALDHEVVLHHAPGPRRGEQHRGDRPEEDAGGHDPQRRRQVGAAEEPRGERDEGGLEREGHRGGGGRGHRQPLRRDPVERGVVAGVAASHAHGHDGPVEAEDPQLGDDVQPGVAEHEDADRRRAVDAREVDVEDHGDGAHERAGVVDERPPGDVPGVLPHQAPPAPR